MLDNKVVSHAEWLRVRYSQYRDPRLGSGPPSISGWTENTAVSRSHGKY
jgi:hypothetical protein